MAGLSGLLAATSDYVFQLTVITRTAARWIAFQPIAPAARGGVRRD